MGLYRTVRDRLFIRADGNSEIGLGHIMRSMTIANEFRKHGYECRYLSSEPICRDIFERYQYEVTALAYPYDEKSIEEAEQISQFIEPSDYVLVDSYYAGNEYLEVLRSHARLICINSIRRRLSTDYLINENIACDKDYIGELYSGSSTRLLLGPEYSPIREEFIGKSCVVKPSVRKVLITTGGGDQYNFMAAFLCRVKNMRFFSEIEFTFVSGGCNAYYDELLNASDGLDHVKVLNNPADMSDLMKENDMAISAGGTTVLELSVVGVPTIGIAVADDQEAGLSFMNSAGMIRYAGRIRDEDFWNRLMKEFETLYSSYEIRKRLSEKSKKCIDGKGARRIFEQITGGRRKLKHCLAISP